MRLLPWVGPVVPPTLHLPVVYFWAVVTSHENPGAVLSWQVVAWPVLAGFCLVTLSPAVWLIEKVGFIPSMSKRVALIGGTTLGIASSFTFQSSLQVSITVAAWFLALCSALCFEQWLNSPGAMSNSDAEAAAR